MAESLRYIEAAVARLGQTIDALLRLARAGRVECDLQRVDIGELVQRIHDSLHATITREGAHISITGVLPPSWGDTIALEQAFANLIGNAVGHLHVIHFDSHHFLSIAVNSAAT